MYWVSSIDRYNGNITYGVTDTVDGVETHGFSKTELLSIAKDDHIDIDGVDIKDNLVCMVCPMSVTERQFKQGNVHLAISKMSMNGCWFGIRFRSKPRGSEIVMRSNKSINIMRTGVNRFCFDFGTPKSYQSDVTLDGIMSVLEGMEGWSIVEVVCDKRL